MGATERSADFVLGEDGVTEGLALSGEMRWNQNEADWRFFLREGTVFAFREAAGTVVATAAILPFGGIAWISLVLVSQAFRRRGHASRLVGACLSQADAARWQCWLDATPDGAKVYEPLGFETVDELVRMRRRATSGVGLGEGVVEAGALDRLITLDAQAIGVSREKLLRDLVARAGSRLYAAEDAVCLVRDGRRARHIGPACAGESDGVALLENVVRSEPGELIIDLYRRNADAHRYLSAQGFVEERPFLRMRRGASPTTPDGRVAFASVGPEYG